MNINDYTVRGRALYEYGVATFAGIGLGAALFFVMLALPDAYLTAASVVGAA